MIGFACMTVVLFYDYNKCTYNSSVVISIITLYTSAAETNECCMGQTDTALSVNVTSVCALVVRGGRQRAHRSDWS